MLAATAGAVSSTPCGSVVEPAPLAVGHHQRLLVDFESFWRVDLSGKTVPDGDEASSPYASYRAPAACVSIGPVSLACGDSFLFLVRLKCASVFEIGINRLLGWKGVEADPRGGWTQWWVVADGIGWLHQLFFSEENPTADRWKFHKLPLQRDSAGDQTTIYARRQVRVAFRDFRHVE